MLLLRGSKGRSLVAQAALGGDKTTFEAVSTTIVMGLQDEMVRYRLLSTQYQC